MFRVLDNCMLLNKVHSLHFTAVRYLILLWSSRFRYTLTSQDNLLCREPLFVNLFNRQPSTSSKLIKYIYTYIYIITPYGLFPSGIRLRALWYPTHIYLERHHGTGRSGDSGTVSIITLRLYLVLRYCSCFIDKWALMQKTWSLRVLSSWSDDAAIRQDSETMTSTVDNYITSHILTRKENSFSMVSVPVSRLRKIKANSTRGKSYRSPRYKISDCKHSGVISHDARDPRQQKVAAVKVHTI